MQKRIFLRLTEPHLYFFLHVFDSAPAYAYKLEEFGPLVGFLSLSRTISAQLLEVYTLLYNITTIKKIKELGRIVVGKTIWMSLALVAPLKALHFMFFFFGFWFFYQFAFKDYMHFSDGPPTSTLTIVQSQLQLLFYLCIIPIHVT